MATTSLTSFIALPCIFWRHSGVKFTLEPQVCDESAKLVHEALELFADQYGIWRRVGLTRVMDQAYPSRSTIRC
jgi:hypothetical protein